MATVGLAVEQLGHSQADVTNGPSLVISQLKISSSSGQFVTLYNATDSTLNMSNYQLEYFNNFDLTKATSSKLIALTGTLPPHGYFMVSDGALLLCYQLTVDTVSLGLSSTAGFVEVVGFNQASPGAAITPVQQDYVAWSKTAAVGAQTLPSSSSAFLQRQPVDTNSNPQVITPGSGSWLSVQPGTNACNLVTTLGAAPITPSSDESLLPSTEPPASIQSLAATTSTVSTPHLPASDIGLMAPTVTELLPNPTGTGNDGTDEFIELYNPNNASFDLSGFILQSGTTSLHTYVFPTGVVLPAQSFTAFYSSTTKLSLSNTAGQVSLLDPFGKILSSSAVYAPAKDGQAWALANSKWYWTSKPTPNAANIVNQSVTNSAKMTSSKSTSTKSHTTGAPTSSSTLSNTKTTADKLLPIHSWILAVIAGAAVLYGTYEYRRDLANYLLQFRRHFSFRRNSGL